MMFQNLSFTIFINMLQLALPLKMDVTKFFFPPIIQIQLLPFFII